MKFKGGPKDKHYRKKVFGGAEEKTKAGQLIAEIKAKYKNQAQSKNQAHRTVTKRPTKLSHGRHQIKSQTSRGKQATMTTDGNSHQQYLDSLANQRTLSPHERIKNKTPIHLDDET